MGTTFDKLGTGISSRCEFTELGMGSYHGMLVTGEVAIKSTISSITVLTSESITEEVEHPDGRSG